MTPAMFGRRPRRPFCALAEGFAQISLKIFGRGGAGGRPLMDRRWAEGLFLLSAHRLLGGRLRFSEPQRRPYALESLGHGFR